MPVGLAASCPHTVFAAELLQALMIDPRHRGQGLGKPALAAVLRAVHDASASNFVMWLVHPENTSMLELSRRIDPEGAQTESGGYYLFGYP
jgi:RimJ/RimL family protein N-acetyltransferase